ncbi:putative proline--tRNA ligase C19C7.06 isoform X2 [Cucumis melo var. makuwa]|uniref:Proline--tRNA ligase C19C7.06 isoform X2 n=1 Tax=Cucumis melo var. makuwa TaxID=1194695 RepID=A0A5D3E2P0_CUCMM|nr:putative proline--tRNA ligase C19C7.06 isoform X2 [Cucumis melo var. makuwa]TYK30347.1 putative proline--tRNA ligase C19C7.06 isoform X2 [Cucumis melo var. makuwa]
MTQRNGVKKLRSLVKSEVVPIENSETCHSLSHGEKVSMEIAEKMILVMVHGDDKGLVLPPKVVLVQVIIVPIPYKDADTQGIFCACATTLDTCQVAHI